MTTIKLTKKSSTEMTSIKNQFNMKRNKKHRNLEGHKYIKREFRIICKEKNDKMLVFRKKIEETQI